MKNVFIKYQTVSFLIIFAVVGVTHANENILVFEMVDGHIITFKRTAEEIAAQEAARAKSNQRQSAIRANLKKNVNVRIFEMGESGLTVAFPATETEVAANAAQNSDGLRLYNALSHQSESKVEKVELPESGQILFFPVNREENDQKKHDHYSQNPK